MRRESEDALLQIAIEQGLLSPVEVANLDSIPQRDSDPVGSRIRKLIELGRLETATLELLTRIKQQEPPVKNWDRYQIIEILGTGGMGRVCKAFDPKLKRFVALKFLRREEPYLQERLMHEAQAQARIQHQHVCEIYEVGEVEGHVYIAMQYIAGKSLRELIHELTVEQKVRILQQICEAVHAAHRLGLIHRDIKPANILVERRDSGILHPYILDFGLVREIDAKGVTLSGVAIGTPTYMSPEQARGDLRLLDRRSDVYSLGVTLYEILTDHVPFDSEIQLEILLKTIQEDPIPLRTKDPSIPEDLETIAMKCLEKERQRRYESAKALAEDLQRYLDAEPILARPASTFYRLKKKAKKYKLVMITLILSLLLIAVFGTITLHSRWTAAEQTRIAQEFGQQVEGMESIMRYSYLLPLHNVRPEKILVLNRMNEIVEQMHQIGDVAEGPGEYAIGRGFLSLHEFNKARLHLEKAWQANYQTREVAYALGQTLGALYRTELEETERISSKELRGMRRKEIDRDYRLPALEYLKRSSGVTSDSTAYVEGLIAFHQKRLEEALRKSQQAFREIPWLYEAKILQADVESAMATQLRDRGNTEAAIRMYAQAKESYRQALEKGTSDAGGYEALCGLHTDLMILQIYQTGYSTKTDFEEGMKSCDAALVADPDSSVAWNLKSNLYWRWGEYQMNHGENPVTALENSERTAAQSIGLNGRNPISHNNRGFALRIRAEYEMDHGRDPGPWLTPAIESFRKTIELNPNYAAAHQNMGNAYWTRGEYQNAHGSDPRPSLQESIRHFRKALEIVPGYFTAATNMGVAYWSLGEYELKHGLDPRPSLDGAIRIFQHSFALNPNYSLSYSNAGGAQVTKSTYEISIGLDPRPLVKQAILNHQKAIAINPNYSYAYSNSAGAYYIIARYEVDHKIDPTESANHANDAAEKAISLNADFDEPFLIYGNVQIALARYAMIQYRSPESCFKKASMALQRALKLNSENTESYRALAELSRWKAEWKASAGQPVYTDIREGLAFVEQALNLQPDSAETLGLRGVLLLQKAKLEKNAGVALQSMASLQQALQINANLKRTYEPYLMEAQKTIPVLAKR